jgi:hypothetical protein
VGWDVSDVSVVHRRLISWWASPVALRGVVDHLSLVLLLLKPFAKTGFFGSALNVSYMSQYGRTVGKEPIGEMSPMLRRTPSTCAAHLADFWWTTKGQFSSRYFLKAIRLYTFQRTITVRVFMSRPGDSIGSG